MNAAETDETVERVVAWLARQPLIPFALLGILGASLAYSLREANWVMTNTDYANAVWLGLLCGAALARSRFRGGAALLYSLCLSLLVSGEWIGGILRAVRLSHANVLWAMSVRMEALLLRVRSWAEILANGGAIHDAGLFVFLSVFILWNAGAWLAWTLVRRRRVWESLLPAACMLAINIHLSGQGPLLLGVVIFVGCLLAAYAGYVQHHTDWDRRQVDYPDEMGISWGGSAAIVALILIPAMWAAVLFGTPAGWRAIGDFWGNAQRRMAEVTARLFSDVNPPRVKPPEAPAGPGSAPASAGPVTAVGTPPPVEVASAALAPDLQLIGNIPDQSPAIVMWVQTSDPPPLPLEGGQHVTTAPPPQHYWRTGIFVTYTGAGWEPLDFPAEAEASGPQVFLSGRYPLLQRYEIPAAHADSIFAVNLPVTATASIQVRYSPLGDSALLKGTVSEYEVLSWATNATVSQLRGAGTDYPPGIAAAYLQLPATLPERVRVLADSITAGSATPYDKAMLVQEYLRDNLTYTLKVPPPRPGQDAVDYFLFEAPGGFCSYYASAMAVMLRAEGVPARVVTGYAMGTYDFKRGAYAVSGDMAHAWVEVYFPGYGWVEFEPTASRSEFARLTEPDAEARARPAPWTLTAISGWLIPLEIAAVGFALLALAVSAVRAYRALEPGWQTPRGRARALYRQMRNSLARAGIRAPANLTPNEFTAAFAAPLAAYPNLARALVEATGLYLRATFSAHTPPPAETGRVWRLWWRAGGDWLRLWWRQSSVVKSVHGGDHHD